MQRLYVLTILRLLEKRWLPGTYTTSETAHTLTITNINNERWQALKTDIVPNTSPNLVALIFNDVCTIYFPEA